MSNKTICTLTHVGQDAPEEAGRQMILARIASKVILSPSGCLEWQASKNSDGYGNVFYRGQRWIVTRLLWTIHKGPIPDGLVACHTCDNPACCTLDHLWLGTRGDNIRDSASKGRHQEQVKTHCPRGHAYDTSNTRVNANGSRHCKICSRGRQRVYSGWPEELAYTVEPVPHGYRTTNSMKTRHTDLNKVSPQ